jgi:hypothetical protein
VPEHRAQLVSIAISLFFTVHMLSCLSLYHGLAFPPRISNPAKSFSPQQFGISFSLYEKTGNSRIDTFPKGAYNPIHKMLTLTAR